MQRISFPDSVTTSQVDDDLILMDTESGAYYGLNATAARATELFQDGLSIDEAARILAGEFDAAEDQIRSDLTTLVAELKKAGLIQVV